MRIWALVVGSVGLLGCGDDIRPVTAPPLPVPILDARCSEYDVGADGTVDAVYAFTYDDDGFLIRYVGTPLAIGVYTYDDDHFLLRYTENSNDDPAPEYEELYTRDRYGRVLTYQQSGAVGVTASATYTYDDEGRLATGATTTSTGSSSIVYTYEGTQLNPSSAVLIVGDGASAFTFTSADDERALHADIDDDQDGAVDRTTDVVYDDARRMLSSISRLAWRVYERDLRVYNGDGNLTSRIYADGEDGPDDWEFFAAFDARGLQTERGVRSASGLYASAVYLETHKTACVLEPFAAAPTSGPRRARLRPSAVELPMTFHAP